MSPEFKEKVKALAEKRGLDTAEDAASDLAHLALDIVGLVIEESETKIDDFIWEKGESRARAWLDKQIDKIDGEQDLPSDS